MSIFLSKRPYLLRRVPDRDHTPPPGEGTPMVTFLRRLPTTLLPAVFKECFFKFSAAAVPNYALLMMDREGEQDWQSVLWCQCQSLQSHAAGCESLTLVDHCCSFKMSKMRPHLSFCFGHEMMMSSKWNQFGPFWTHVTALAKWLRAVCDCLTSLFHHRLSRARLMGSHLRNFVVIYSGMIKNHNRYVNFQFASE